ncbi:Protein of unknown function [Halolactibacillus halophilus]|uniref:DUF1510 domain-containing protein n=1 Tax=Halolactibacillus halophilus TaxID=306540 RepID=A0A1I5KW94_9BACI|nr:YrrS family protein [Halolactibacillus halophilus]GEM00537.1 hypothetical protein HHA03_00690 [Halolactibacillus halophilus]SFO89410.1 Protein of unknown function [Halolactibacillus halophilus]
MEDDIVFSRTRRLNKKRKNKRWLVILIGILVVFLLSVISAPIISQIMFSDDEATEETMNSAVDESTDDSTEDDQANKTTDDQGATEEEPDVVTGADEDKGADVGEDADQTDDGNESTDVPKNPDDYDLTFSESDDENVLSRYKADWDAVPTTQTQPHTISFEQDTDDWNEMLEAATLATGIDSEAMQYLWVSGNGPNKVITTYTDRDSKEHFRVYIEWVESEGYTPTQVDLLKEHDQMSRFSTTSETETEDDTSVTDSSDDDNL